MQAQTATAEQVLNIVAKHKNNGKVFGVCFTKKDGSLRKMACRFNVKSYLRTEGTPSTTAHIAKYITVFDMHKQAYRNVNLNTLLHIVSEQTKYVLQ